MCGKGQAKSWSGKIETTTTTTRGRTGDLLQMYIVITIIDIINKNNDLRMLLCNEFTPICPSSLGFSGITRWQ